MRKSLTALAAAAAVLTGIGIAQAQNDSRTDVPSTGDHGVEGAIKPAPRGPSTTGAAPSGSYSRETGPAARHQSGGPSDRPTSNLPNAGDSRGASPNAK